MKLRYVALALLFFLLPVFGWAQASFGSITGTVTDAQGAAVAGANITVTSLGQGTTRTTVADDSGNYLVPSLIPGRYQVTVEKTGFKKSQSNPLELQVDQRAALDFSLQVGNVSDTVEVSASAPLVRSETAELGEVIEERQVRELPLNGRNFAQLVYLVPGVTPGQAGENLSGASTFNPRGASNFNALGSQANTNAWLIDGIDNNEFTFNTVIVQPNVESIREFKVLTGTYSAEYGRGAGVVTVVTKSGQNDFHGSAFEFLRNNYFDARNYFQNRFNAQGQEVPKPPLRRNQFGAVFSGPVWIPKLYNGRNKTFFFADYAGLREFRGLTFVNSVPTAAVRNGDFSDYRGPNGQLIPIFDPLTSRIDPASGRVIRDQFPGNIIPASRINPVSRNVASIYPLPTGQGNFNNFNSVANSTIGDNSYTIRGDHSFGTNDNLFVRFSRGLFTRNAPAGQAACCLPTPAEAAQRFQLGPFVAGTQNTDLRTMGLAANYVKVFSPAVLNEFRAGFARTVPFTFQSDLGINAAESLGIRGINVNPLATGLPNIDIQDFTGISGGPGFLPVNPRQTHWQINNNVSWTIDRHQTKFGVQYVRRYMSPVTSPSNTRGNFGFNRDLTNSNNAGGAGFASFLLGNVVAGGTRGFLLQDPKLNNQDLALFFQDDWKVTRRLTLNLGLRWEVFFPEWEDNNRLTNFDTTSLRLVYAGQDGINRAAGKKTRWNNFGPRIGLAYDLFGTGRTVVRSGFAISYFPVPHSASSLLTQQVPWVVSQSLIGADLIRTGSDLANFRTIDNPFPAITDVRPRTTAELVAANPGIRGHSFENQTPSMMTWNFNIEQQIGSSTLLEVAYAGSGARHLIMALDFNPVQPGPGAIPQAQRRLFPQLGNFNFTQFDPRNSSAYHGLQTKLVQRYAKGLSGLISYTWSKSLDYGGAPASGGGAVGGPQNVTLLGVARGRSGFDVTHRFVSSLVYELPGQKMKGPVGWLFGGWQTNSILTLSTGRPFTVFSNTNFTSGSANWPDRIGSGQLDNPTRTRWYDSTAFVNPSTPRYGNSGRGILTGPPTRTLDGGLAKNFYVTETAKFQFRVEAFNLTNTPQFGFPNQNFDAPTAGVITSTIGDNRSVQLALRFDF